MKQFKVWFYDHQTRRWLTGWVPNYPELGVEGIVINTDGNVKVRFSSSCSYDKPEWPASWLSDIDPDNIPNDCRCIVQEMVTERAGEGDLLQCDKAVIRCYYDKEEMFWAGEVVVEDGEWMGGRIYPELVNTSKIIGHVLSHKIVNCEVMKR